ncbi:MotA/TolQ/ExbB proton channel family protein [Desulfatiferula olefinivorans]
MMTTHVSLLAFYAARVILGILLVLSVLTLAFFIERMIFFRRRFLRHDTLLPELENALSLKEVSTILMQHDSAETAVVLKGLNHGHPTAKGFSHHVSACFHMEKQTWERYSNFLGSVGSNAPFIGLLGTVLGILKSFADLGMAKAAGPQVVMAGISEALIVTAVGLAVAIPAVVFFNICKTKIKAGSVRVESIIDMICSKNLFREGRL